MGFVKKKNGQEERDRHKKQSTLINPWWVNSTTQPISSSPSPFFFFARRDDMAALPDPKTVNPDETFAKPPWDAPNTPYTNRPPLSQTLQSYYGALKGGGGAYRHVLTTHVAQGEAWSKIVGTRVKDTVIPRTGEPLIKDCRALFDYRSLELMFMHSDHRSLDYLLRYVMMKSAFGPPHPPVLVELLPRALTARPTLVGLCAIKTAEALQEIGKGGVLKLAEPPSSGSLVNQALAPLSILLDFPEWGALVVESPEKVFYMWDQAIELALKKRLSPPPSAEGKGQGGGEASIWDKILAVLVCRRAYLTHLLQEKSGKGYEEIEKVTNPIVNRIPDEITQEKVRYQARYPKSSGDLFAMVGLRISFKKPVIKFEDLIFAAIGNNLGKNFSLLHGPSLKKITTTPNQQARPPRQQEKHLPKVSLSRHRLLPLN